MKLLLFAFVGLAIAHLHGEAFADHIKQMAMFFWHLDDFNEEFPEFDPYDVVDWDNLSPEEQADIEDYYNYLQNYNNNGLDNPDYDPEYEYYPYYYYYDYDDDELYGEEPVRTKIKRHLIQPKSSSPTE